MERAAIIASNALFICGSVLIYTAILPFLNQRGRPRWLMGFCAAPILAIAWFTFVADRVRVRRVIITIGLTVTEVLIVRTFRLQDKFD